MEKISFVTEDGTTEEFFVIEETRVAGVNYLMVTDMDSEDDDEAVAYILKDTSSEQDTEACYVFVEDDRELDAVSAVFEELLSDSDYSVE